ncbi:hypothetical protein OKW35_009117 [Paraburkholderia sp. MM5477-R1]
MTGTVASNLSDIVVQWAKEGYGSVGGDGRALVVVGADSGVHRVSQGATDARTVCTGDARRGRTLSCACQDPVLTRLRFYTLEAVSSSASSSSLR